MEHIRLIDKPIGISSFDVIRRLREQYHAKGERVPKMGHAGTLDPAASGLMLIGIGREGTKQLTELTGLDKTYEVTVELGVRTDTGDRDGEVLEERAVSDISDDELERARATCIGELELAVPLYSAVKVDGVPLYKRTRRGEDVPPPVRYMRVYDLRMTGRHKQDGRVFIDMEMDVASGVYVRSVVEAFGEHLDVPATTAALRRTRVGTFSVENSEQLV